MEVEFMGLLFKPWHLWLIAAILLFIFEIFAPGFVLACIAIGCLGGMIADLFGASLNVQYLVMGIVGLASFFTIRPAAKKIFFEGRETPTNVDSLLNRKAEVTAAFNQKTKLGRVKVDGDDWRAETESEIELKEGDLVKILRVESNTLIVEPI